MLPEIGNFNVRTDVDACSCTRGLYGHSGRKVPCSTPPSNPRQYCAWLFSRTPYQLGHSRPFIETYSPTDSWVSWSERVAAATVDGTPLGGSGRQPDGVGEYPRILLGPCVVLGVRVDNDAQSPVTGRDVYLYRMSHQLDMIMTARLTAMSTSTNMIMTAR